MITGDGWTAEGRLVQESPTNFQTRRLNPSPDLIESIL
jgi:hypothetical protein